jgi:hypothetical protein
MTNADIAEKQSTFKVWEMFNETEVKPPALSGATVEPAQSSTPTAKPVGPHKTEPAAEKPTEEDMKKKKEDTQNRNIDHRIQKPFKPEHHGKGNKHRVEQYRPEPNHGKEIMGPKAPKLDPNQPVPGGGSGKDHRSGVYPNIYGPESRDPPGRREYDNNYIPAAEFPANPFPAGPEYPSPYLNDFSRILKM